jgi:hypothetical protein
MVLLIVALALATVLATMLALSARWRRNTPRIGRALRLAAVAVTIGTNLAVLPLLISDQAGTVGIAIVTLPPMVLTLAAAAAPLLGRSAAEAIVTWIVSALMFVYVIVYGLGVGLFYLPAALLVLVTALTRTRPIHQSPSPSDAAAKG